MQGKLILSDGATFIGESFGADVSSSGEVVFNTGMVGYPESLTDPSYFGQILVLTYPIIGSYGVPNPKYFESRKIWVRGLIVQNYIDSPSHFASIMSLGEWLKKEGIPALQGIDTRALTTKLRSQGAMLGRLTVIPARFAEASARRAKAGIHSNAGKILNQVQNDKNEIYNPNLENVLQFVSIEKPQTYGTGKKNVVVIDCGAKQNIIRSLLKRKLRVTVAPWNFDPIEEKWNFDGVLISNGPGNPKNSKDTILTIKNLLSQSVPVFGICLGSQLLALAAGGDTYKLKFGHRGQNQPVQNLITKKAIITSQNHGFAVNFTSMPLGWSEWFINLNDGSNEGIRHKKKPFLAVQFHPEASPGPTDAEYLFDEFISMI
ncbi:glutamine-hydrolyzing carbamoyl-phosphate synthase small subunit [Candidatus Daviesbacteria bacterium]|nr:glutamine-hydrolyzing carbamoyl-phosphate synthase small subunit [Candidatus Daviesbacteria bacterium]